MSIKWKFFLTLLAFSLGPLVVTGIISHVGITGLGRSVSARVGRDMTTIVVHELEDTAEDAARSLAKDRVMFEFAVRNLVLETKKVLKQPAVPADQLYFSTDYNMPETAPEDLAPLKGHFRRNENGATEPIRGSLGRQVFFPAPGVDIRSVTDDIWRLAALQPVCRKAWDNISETAIRMHVALESGITAVYPGSPGYPEAYDTRKTVYYTSAANSDRPGPVWTRLIFSRSTGRAFFSVAMPIREGSKLLGVAAVDFPLEHALKEQVFEASWSGQVRSFLVFPELNETTGRTGLKVAAQKQYVDTARDLLGSEEFPWLELPDSRGRTEMIADIAAGKKGSAVVDFQGEPSLCAFAPLSDTLSFLIVVPKNAAMLLPEEIVRRVDSMTRGQFMITGIAAGVAVLLAMITALIGARRAGAPLMEWVGAWNRAAEGDFSVRITRRTNDERDRIVEAFNATMPKLEERMRIRRALDLAHQVQQNLLPSSPSAPAGWDAAGVSRCCDETGGDYLDFHSLSGTGCYQVVVGDVSGHGVASALLMASARAMLRALSLRDSTLSERVSMVNRLLCADVGGSGRFMTLFVLELEPETGELRWVRAGHDPALLYDPASGSFTELEGTGMLMGVVEEAEYPESIIAVEPGRVLAVGTDGIWESRNTDGEYYGRGRFKEIIARHARESAEDIIQAVFADLDAFRNGASQNDDVTLAVIKREE